MSKYTTEVRFICEAYAGLDESVGLSDVESVIQKAIPKLFDFNFPIYDEKYRNVLCTKILKHYYTREICAETVGLWKLWLNSRLNEIMPYYNELYKSAMLEFNPLYDVELTTTHTTKNNGSTDTVGSSSATAKGNNSTNINNTLSGTNKNLFSDTPQGALDNVDNEKYLTNATKIVDNRTEESIDTNDYNDNRTNERNDKVTATNTEEYIESIKGKNGGVSFSKMIMEFRKSIINVDSLIIENLSDLFFNLW